MPLVRRVPKRGFNNKFAVNVAVVNVGDLQNQFQAGDEVSPEILRQRGIVKHDYDELKVLGNGELTSKLKVSAHRFSQSAKEQIEKSGGEVVVLPGPTPVKEKQKQSRQEKQSTAKKSSTAKK
jgi:large subunit ribosomal protein L15